jgi:hypothetical protein
MTTTEQVFIHLTDLKGARGMVKSKELWQSSYVQAIFAIAVGGEYVPGVQRSSLGRAKTRSFAVYFTTPVKPDYCRTEECVWHGDKIPITVLKVIPANLAAKKDLTGSLPYDPDTDQIIGVDTVERPLSKFPTLKELYIQQETPEAGSADPLGVSFDDPAKRKPENKPPELNTAIERELIKQIEDFIAWDRQGAGNLGKILLSLKPTIDQGKYPQLAPPPNTLVYRGMVLEPKEFSSIVKMTENEVVEKPGTGWYIGSSGILKPKGKNPLRVSSWTLNPKIALKFATAKMETTGDFSADSVFVIFTATTANPKNNFFINPNLTPKLYARSANPLVNITALQEKEVFGVGSVIFQDCAFYTMPGEHAEKAFWELASDAPEFPFFMQAIAAELSKSETIKNEEIVDKAIRDAMGQVIRKFKWKELTNPRKAANQIDQNGLGYEAWENAAVNKKDATLGPLSVNVVKRLQQELLRAKNVFPKDLAIYSPEKSLLYSLGLVEKEPKALAAWQVDSL